MTAKVKRTRSMPSAARNVIYTCSCAMILACAGCASTPAVWTLGSWSAGYENAERVARSSGRALLVYYRTTDQSMPDPVYDALQSRDVKSRTSNFITCQLFQSYEPDRRFVAQYGVQRAPALILIHPDGTYHAQAGMVTPAQIAQFLDAAVPPGSPPALNPHLARAPAYGWYASLDTAKAAGERTGRPVLVVLDRWQTRDWDRLRPMLERREVYARFADMIHCRPSSFWGSAESARKQLGVAVLPALVIIRPDGSHHAIELPTSYEAIVRFADTARAAGSGNSAASATHSAG